VALRRWLAAAAIAEEHVCRVDRPGHLGRTLFDQALAEIRAYPAAVAGLERLP
jgi:hypothetical protein